MEATQQTRREGGTQGGAGTALRVYWMLLGNFALVLMAGHIAVNEGGRLTAADAVYGGLLVALILARVLDVTRFEGQTTDGGRATVADLRRFAVLALLGYGALLGAAHAVGAWLLA